MSCSSPFSYVQRFAQKLSPSCIDGQNPVYSDSSSQSAQSHSSYYLLHRLGNRSLTEDSDSSSQTSSQESSQDGTDGSCTSPPTSVSSDGDSSCEQRNITDSQEHASFHQTEPSSTRTFSSLQNDGQSVHYQEPQVVPFRPRATAHLQEQSQQYRLPQISSQCSSSSTTPQPSQSTTSTLSSDRLQSRRRACPLTGFMVPPKLRRDTDNTEAIVKMIVVFCTNLINSIWCPRASEQNTSTSINNSGVLPLQLFIQETLRRSKTSYSTLQVALYYLIILKQCLSSSSSASEAGQPGCRAMQCGRRMFLTALILASKYLQDRNYSARAWSKISGLPLQEINENERRYLSVIRWDLHMPKDTFENWSKIVLAICRLSSDGDVPGRNLDQQPPTPGAGSQSLKYSQSPILLAGNSASKSWWSIQLKALHTSMVKCSRTTENFLVSLSPFRPMSTMSSQFFFDPLPRISSPTESADGEAESTPKCLSKLPSIEKLSQSFQLQERSTSPSTAYKIPPQPLLRNLPTPQTTPRAETTNMWTPKFSRNNLRCRASASALGNVEKSVLPSANLDLCPPPRPRPVDAVKPSSESMWTDNFNHWQSAKESSAHSSSSSSPESVVSDFSSVAPRSRSSSISSTSSWAPLIMNTITPDVDPRFRRDVFKSQQRMTCERGSTPLKHSNLNECRPNIPRCQTAFKSAAYADEGCFTVDQSIPQLKHSQSLRFHDEGYGSDDYAVPSQKSRTEEAAEILLAFQSKNVSHDSFANTMSATQRPSQQLKRCRSDTTELVQFDTRSLLLNKQQPCKVVDDSWSSDVAQKDNQQKQRQMQVQVPHQPWATPRKPVPCGSQNKRLAVQRAESASSVASDYLRRDIMVG